MKKNKKLWLFAGVIVVILVLNHFFGWSDYLSKKENLEFLKDLVEENQVLAGTIYTVLTIIGCVFLALPGITFAIVAGVVFGPVLGTILCSFATTLGAMLAFAAGRFFLKDTVKPMAMKNKYLKKWLFDETGQNELFILMITRLVPVFPYNLQNFAYGVTDIKFSTYSLASLVFMLPGTAMYTVGTAGILNKENRGLYIGIAVLLAGAVLCVGAYLKKHYVGEGPAEAENGKQDGFGPVEKRTDEVEEACIHCHKCRRHCAFLQKYQIDIGDTERLRELAYHCFLCGKCTEVCPVGIDGREYILSLRRQSRQSQTGKQDQDHRLLLWEKQNYRYRNYRHTAGKSALFSGCNFPSFYPKTTKALAELLSEYGIGIVYDCCGKPIAELGYAEDEEAIVKRIDERLREKGIEELVMVCPNCYAFLKDRLSVRVVDIYTKLAELDVRLENIRWEQGEKAVFLPCPDREKQEILAAIQQCVKRAAGADSGLRPIEGAQCCGLGGVAGAKEPKLAQSMASAFSEEEKTVYTYCASCSGNLTRGGCGDVRYVLSEILGVHEKADVKKSMLNRVKTKFI